MRVFVFVASLLSSPCAFAQGWPAVNTPLDAARAQAEVAKNDLSNITLPDARSNLGLEISAPSDGVTDAAPAIQAGIDAAAAAGVGCAILPPPAVAYKIGATLSLPAKACLDGVAGFATVLKLADGVNAALIQTASSAEGVTIRNIRLDGNKANNTAGACILIASGSSKKILLDNVWAHDCYAEGARFSAVDGLEVRGGGFYSNGSGGLTAGGGTTNFKFGPGVSAYLNGTHGIGCIDECTRGLITGNIAWDNGQGQPVTGAKADNYTGYNVDISDIVLSDNISVGGGNHGIHWGGNRISYLNNIVKSPTLNGIFHRSARVYSTGTVSVTNGSTAVTGTGTAWLTLYPYGGFKTILTISGIEYAIRRVNSDTSLTLKTAFPGATASGLAYGLNGPVASSDVVITGNKSDAAAGFFSITVEQVNGGAICGNSDENTTAFAGLGIFGSSNLAICPNNFSKKTGIGAEFNSEVAAYTTGTVTTTNGSAIITGAGTAWLNNAAPSGSYFLVAGDTTAYQVQSVDSDTQITLTTNYTCTSCGAGKSYTVAAGLNRKIGVFGGTYNDNGSVGVRVRNTLDSTFTGISASSNAVFGVQEREVAAGNEYYMLAGVGNGTSLHSLLSGNLLSLRNGSNPQGFRTYNSFTNASNGEWGELSWASNVLNIGTNQNGTGVARALNLRAGGALAQHIDTSQRVAFGTSSSLAAQVSISGLGQTSAAFDTAGALGGALLLNDNDAVANGRGGALIFGHAMTRRFAVIKGMLIDSTNNASGDIAFSVRPLAADATLTEALRVRYTGLVTFGGITSAFPALKRSGTTLQARLADDSGYATLDAGALNDQGAAPTGTAGTGYVRATAATLTDARLIGHPRVTGSAPALSSCGTDPAIVGSDIAGEVTMGTGTPTGCTITFAAAYTSAPFCVVTWQSNLAAMAYTVSTTAITLTQTATNSNKVNYYCMARSGG